MEVVPGDITEERTDVIVNSTNESLNLTGGNCTRPQFQIIFQVSAAFGVFSGLFFRMCVNIWGVITKGSFTFDF